MIEVNSLQPLAPYILIKRLPPETKFGHLMINLPDSQYYKNRRVEIVATHKGRRMKNGTIVPSDVKPGDLAEVIVFDGTVFDLYDNPDYEFVDEDNILAVVENVKDR